MRTRSKKTKTAINNLQTSKEKVLSEQRINIDQLPLDLLIEIIGRLPVKSVVKFITISKLWAKTIASREFITSFPIGSSSSQPRTLIASVLPTRSSASSFKYRGYKDMYFFKRSSSSSKSFLSRVTCPSPYPNNIEYCYHHVNGLISLGYGQEQIITNPSTGKSINLPKVKTRRRVVKSFFGYDSVNDQYKVLSMTERLHGYQELPSSQHQVLTLGAKSWKMLKCSIPDHRPWSNGVCIDGVVYYVAKTGAGMLHLSLMRFDVRFDKLDLLTSLPAEIPTRLYRYTLITYKGKVAIPIATSLYTFDVWLIDQAAAKHEWLKKLTFSIKPWKSSFFADHYLCVGGTTHTGEFILAPTHYSSNFYVFYYNPDANRFRHVEFAVSKENAFKFYRKRAIVFSDYVESLRLLDKQFMV